MHFLALLAQGAAVFEYLVPITYETCLHTRRVMLSTFSLFDVSKRSDQIPAESSVVVVLLQSSRTKK